MSTNDTQLEIKRQLDEITTIYQEKKEERLISALVYGAGKSGKTRLISTARQPIHIDSFDPNGTDTIREHIYSSSNPGGFIIADTRYEHEDPTNPSAFEEWDKKYHERKKSGYFSNFGTYALDGITTFADSVMNYILYGAPSKGAKQQGYRGRKSDRSDLSSEHLAIPQENDYPIQMAILKNVISDILTLPCDIIIVGHLEEKKNKQGLIVGKGLYITGKLTVRIPRLFQEIYVTAVEDSSSGPKYHLVTQQDGMIEAGTRLGKGGLFAFKEEPNIMKLLQKAGLNPKHKSRWWKEMK